MNALSNWPRNRLLLALPIRDLKRIMPDLEDIRCQRAQVLTRSLLRAACPHPLETLTSTVLDFSQDWHLKVCRSIPNQCLTCVGIIGTSPFVFVSERGSPFTTTGFVRMVERAAAAAGLEINAHPHMLHHACGCALAHRATCHHG